MSAQHVLSFRSHDSGMPKGKLYYHANCSCGWASGGWSVEVLRDCHVEHIADVEDAAERRGLKARIETAAPDLLEACQAEEAAYDARAGCPECEGEGQWEHCGPCSERFGDAIVLRRAAIAKAVHPMTRQPILERGNCT